MVELRELDETATRVSGVDGSLVQKNTIFWALSNILQLVYEVFAWLITFLKSLVISGRRERGQINDTAGATDRRMIRFQGDLRDNCDNLGINITVPEGLLDLFNEPGADFQMLSKALISLPMALFFSIRRVIYKPSNTYEKVMAEFIQLEDNGDFDEFDNYVSKIVERYSDNDPDVVAAVIVEQAQSMIYQNRLRKARSLVKKGLELSRHTSCPPLFQARAHTMMSTIYKKEKKFGFCEDHLRLAEQNLSSVYNYEDLAHFHECYGSFMYKFIGSVPHNDESLKKSAISSFKKMFDVASKDSRARVRDKNHFYALIKMTKTLLDSNSSFGRCRRTVSPEDVALAEKYLGIIKRALWKSVPRGTQIQFHLVTSDLYFRQGRFEEAIRLQERCLLEAKKLGFKTEEPIIKQVPNRKNRQHTLYPTFPVN